MKKLFFIYCLFVTTLTASTCEDSSTFPCEESDWLKQRITSMRVRSSAGKGYIAQYFYKGQTVILIDDCSNCSDAMQVLYDCSGNELCQFGGIAGLNTCPDFESKGRFVRMLYEIK